MLLLALSYLGGFLTILSPCILPVLPFVFSKVDRNFLKTGLPLLLGMAVTFASVSLIAILGGNWVGQAGEVGRWVAVVLMTFFAVSLIFPVYLETWLRPLTRIGVKLQQTQGKKESPLTSFIIGIATGFLWAPCAGPILGLILTGAATQKSALGSASFLLAYALGAASSLALALFAGKNIFNRLKKSLKAEAYLRKAIGVAISIGVITIVFNLDRTILTKISKFQTESLEQQLIGFLDRKGEMPNNFRVGQLDDLKLAGPWFNSEPLSQTELKGKVVLIDFWTYSCINCIRTLPYVKAWSQKYKEAGLVVIGVHTPEFGFEKKPENVQAAMKDLGITYPVALDNDFKVWKEFNNRYWPAHYFIDRSGKIRHHHFGEGEYARSEKIIQKLLSETEAESRLINQELAVNEAVDAQAPTDFSKIRSPETYIGYQRIKGHKMTPEIKRKSTEIYQTPETLNLNEWGLSGKWTIQSQYAELEEAGGKITYRFQARDVHLVLGSNSNQELRYRVKIDGQPPGADHGVDVNPQGEGSIREHRLYQLIRIKDVNDIKTRTFEIEFLDPGTRAYAFTFG